MIKKGNPRNGLKPNKKHEIFGTKHSGDPLNFCLHPRRGIGGRTEESDEYKKCLRESEDEREMENVTLLGQFVWQTMMPEMI